MAENKQKQVDPFTPSQKVWLIDNRPDEVDEIRGALTPEVVTCDTYNYIADNIAGRLSMSPDSYGTIIISENIPNKIQERMGILIEAINNSEVVNRIFVFQITDKYSSPFVNAKTYPDVRTFLDAANNIHLDRVTDSVDIDEQAKQMIRQLKSSKNEYQARYEEEVKTNHDLTETLEQTQSHLKQIETKIAYYEQKINEADEKSAKADQTVEDNEQKIKNLTTGLDLARAQANKDKDTIIELKAKIEGQQKTISEISVKNNGLQVNIQDLQSQYDDIQETNRNLLKAKTDAERVGEIQNQFNAVQEKNADLKKTIETLKQDLVVRDNEITSLEQTNKEIRSGYRDYSQIGYSNVFPQIQLNKTNVLYFKVIDDLPYHRFYINRIREMMNRVMTGGSHIVTVMMKIDQGEDRERFDDYTFISDLNGINEDHDKYYLLPSKRMNEYIEDFEQQNVTILFVDYIDNSKYYLSSQGIVDYFNVVKESSIASKIFHLKGLPISYDHRSILDIKYNGSINTMTTQNKNAYFDENVQNLLVSSRVVSSNVGE